ncbi:lactonase family protein [Novosphingobium flavum]|uniref:Lactonase family protein n=1 Tax=Novosphingobium flavum TaxID=1778672 RepID=A0A7X1KLA4_9SPHN|nr:lactonase family protein [Novosphingobium flavum]MBC2665367.1 lactonase family protein [Novosphingobium flavum]
MSAGRFYVYVSEHASKQISVLQLDPDSGALTPIQQISATGKVMPMAISPDRRFLYAALRNQPWSFATFAIDGSSGRLTHLGNTLAHESMVNIVTDRTGRFMIAANNPKREQRTGILTVFAIGPQGFVQEGCDMVRTPPKLHSVIPDPTNRFIFGASCDGDAIVRHRFDAVTGALDLEPLSPIMVEPGRGPRHLRFHPSGRFLYVVNEYDASVCAFRYHPQSGMLSEIQIADAKPDGFEPVDQHSKAGAGGSDLHCTPDGKWLYVSVRGSLTIAAFRVDPATGRLTNAGHFPAPADPRGFAIDPFGRFLLAAGDVSGNLVVYRIDGASGALDQLAEYSVGDGPNWVECVRLP